MFFEPSFGPMVGHWLAAVLDSGASMLRLLMKSARGIRPLLLKTIPGIFGGLSGGAGGIGG